MASLITMPKQGLLMEEGTITDWLVKEGGRVTEGDPLFEMETDKLTITMDSTATGTLLKIIHPVGDVVPITKPIAIIGEPDEDYSVLLGNDDSVSTEAKKSVAVKPTAETTVEPVLPAEKAATKFSSKASPRAKMRAEENNVAISHVVGTGPEGFIIENDVLKYMKDKPKATPLAAKIALAAGKSLEGVIGTGVNGKITATDVSGLTLSPAGAVRKVRTVPMSGMRKAISRNMMLSKETNAQTCHFISVDMTSVMELRNHFKAKDIKISFNDIIMRVCVKALCDFPVVNASIEGNNIIYHDYVNIGNAVALPDGLIVPNVKDAGKLTLLEIAKKSAELIEKAKTGSLSEEDYHEGTFTVTSLGMYDVDEFVAIINPPESAILAVGMIKKTPVVVTDVTGNDMVAIKPICKFCLSYDHRIIDGAVAAKFIKQIKDNLEYPASML